jgi:hypothetical protein
MISKGAHEMRWQDRFVFGLYNLVFRVIFLATSASSMNIIGFSSSFYGYSPNYLSYSLVGQGFTCGNGRVANGFIVLNDLSRKTSKDYKTCRQVEGICDIGH